MSFNNPVVGGTALVRESIHSPDYEPGSKGWTINRDGTAEFSDVTVRGDIELGPGAVRQENIAPGAVGSDELADGAVGPDELADGAVGPDELADRSVTGGKLAAALVLSSRIIAGDPDGAHVELNANGIEAVASDGTPTFSVDAATGDVALTGSAQSQNYSPGGDGWAIDVDGTAEFNGTVGMGAGVVTGSIKSANYAAGNAGWKMNADGTAEFNGSIVTTLADGKVHTGSSVDTSRTNVGTSINVSNANPQNTVQVAGHAYRALVQVAVSATSAGSRIQYRLLDGTTQLGKMTPNVKVQATSGTYETVLLMFVWKASSTYQISNLNLEMTYQQGTSGSPVWTRVSEGDFAFIVEDLGLSGRITNL